ncbi:MAG: hypothetical protein WD065_17305 [Planctomycetaceae bacterium]
MTAKADMAILRLNLRSPPVTAWNMGINPFSGNKNRMSNFRSLQDKKVQIKYQSENAQTVNILKTTGVMV